MSDNSRSQFQKFEDLTRRLLAVPKSQVPKHVRKKRAKSPRPKRKNCGTPLALARMAAVASGRRCN